MKRRQGYVKDFYEILGVSEEASYSEIKTAYRLLARKYHPDVTQETDGEERFKEVQQAYATLKDPVERSYYNQVREQAKRQTNYEPDREAYRYWQSPPPQRKTFRRKLLHWAIVLFWFFLGLAGTTLRRVFAGSLIFLIHGLGRFIALYLLVLIAMGVVFLGNPFVIDNLTKHPQATFACYGVPLLTVIGALVANRMIDWLIQEGPLFPRMQNWMNGLRYRSLCI